MLLSKMVRFTLLALVALFAAAMMAGTANAAVSAPAIQHVNYIQYVNLIYPDGYVALIDQGCAVKYGITEHNGEYPSSARNDCFSYYLDLWSQLGAQGSCLQINPGTATGQFHNTWRSYTISYRQCP